MKAPQRSPPLLWRRNLIGGIVAALATAVIVGTQFYPSWSSYRATVVPRYVVPAGGKLDAYGQTWQLDSSQRLQVGPPALANRKLPSGTYLFVVRIGRSGAPTLSSFCVGVATDGSRRWRDEQIGVFNIFPDDGATTQCGKPGVLLYTFLLPRGAEPTAVDVTDNKGILLRIAL
jgi:hypothetical protein